MLKKSLSIGAEIAYLQKPFIGNTRLSYSILNLYWPGRLRNKARILIAIKKEFVNRCRSISSQLMLGI